MAKVGRKKGGKNKPKILPDVKGKTKGTIADLAKILRVTGMAVKHLVKRQILTPLPDGSFYLEDAVKEYHAKVNPAIGAHRSGDISNSPINYHEARARREVAEAAMAELNLRKVENQLLDADVAKKTFMDVATAVRDRLLGLPLRLGPSLVGLVDEKQAVDLLNNEIQDALAGLDRNVFA